MVKEKKMPNYEDVKEWMKKCLSSDIELISLSGGAQYRHRKFFLDEEENQQQEEEEEEEEEQ